MRYLLIFLMLLSSKIFFAQIKICEHKLKNVRIDSLFDKVFVSFLEKHPFKYKTKNCAEWDLNRIIKSYSNIFNARKHNLNLTKKQLSEIASKKEFNDLDFCRSVSTFEPFFASVEQLHFKKLNSAIAVEKTLNMFERDMTISVVPDRYEFIRIGNSILLVGSLHSGLYKNEKFIALKKHLSKIRFSYLSPPAFLYKSKYVNLAIGNEFESLFGEVLAPYNKVLFDEAKRKEAIEVIAKDFNRLLTTKAFSQLMYVKRLGVKKPLELEAFEFRFSTDYSLQVVKKILDKYPADSNIGDKLAPRFFSYKCHDESIFLILHGNPTGSSGIKSMRMAFKAYFPY
jgi:hypothetical protein